MLQFVFSEADESKLEKLQTSCTGILLPTVSVLCLTFICAEALITVEERDYLLLNYSVQEDKSVFVSAVRTSRFSTGQIMLFLSFY